MSEKITHLRQKILQSPDSILLKFSLGQVLFEEKEWNESIRLFEECLKGRPDWMIASLYLGKAYLMQGKIQSAQTNLSLTMDLAKKQGHEDPYQEASELLLSIEKDSG